MRRSAPHFDGSPACAVRPASWTCGSRGPPSESFRRFPWGCAHRNCC